MSTASTLLSNAINIYNNILNYTDETIENLWQGDDPDNDALIEGLKAGKEKILKWYQWTDGAVYVDAMGKFSSSPLAATLTIILHQIAVDATQKFHCTRE